MNIYVILYGEDRCFVATSSIHEAIRIWSVTNDMGPDDEPDHVLRINDLDDEVVIDGSSLFDEKFDEECSEESSEGCYTSKDLEEKW